MTINISSKQMDVTPAIRSHIEERLAKLNKWKIQLISPHFMIHKLPNGYEVEASIGTPAGELFAKAQDEDLYKAINDVETKLETQLNKQKQKEEARRTDDSLKNLNEVVE
ncbi:ribosome-associated translation inhibitor RaiA [Otariodibacter sp.]|uniref:ribosome hibernation-promoting factor, HPF/YfiA family n=1 Tax=Otariodibacter sp. TaxID=3030919 RepID=UPI002620AAAA|nr:ribosome-associated translation inhibitor RaiA [Otariodibacter sp.]